MAAIFGIILAGGAGRRMGGRDKALLTLAGRPLVAGLAERLAPQVAALAVSANGDPARFAGLGLAHPQAGPVPVLPDPVAGAAGPLAGILAGLDWAAAAGAGWLVSVPVDTPFVPGDLVAGLAAPRLAAPVMAESGSGLHPAVALWPVALAGALRAALDRGERRVGAFATSAGAARRRFPDRNGIDPFLNLNTPEDLARAESLAGAAR